MEKPKLRIVKAGMMRAYALEVLDPGQDEFRRYIRACGGEIDRILAELKPEDGEVVYDVRRAA